jgi:predicted amidophosphoribosyltransferase
MAGGSLVEIHPQRIEGNWRAGIALDFQTLSSAYTGDSPQGHPTFDTVRLEIAELLYRLKYRQDQSAAAAIVDAASTYLAPAADKFDLIVPVPPSAQRAVQPVILLAEGIGATLGKPVAQCVTPTRPTRQLKEESDPAKRQALVDGLYAVDAGQTARKRILLFDDLFRSGTTMNAITNVLFGAGQAADVIALTITCTRSHR